MSEESCINMFTVQGNTSTSKENNLLESEISETTLNATTLKHGSTIDGEINNATNRIGELNVKLDKKHELDNIKESKRKKKKSKRLTIPKYYQDGCAKDAFYRNSKGETQLHIACTMGWENPAGYLLMDFEMNPNIKDNAGWTPLHEAVRVGRLDWLEMFIEYDGNIEAPGYEYETPLYLAVKCGHFDIAEELIRNGADINCINKYGESLESLNPEMWSELSKIPSEEIEMSRLPEIIHNEFCCMNRETYFLYFCNVSLDKAVVEQFCSRFRLTLVENIMNGDYSELSHMVVPETENNTCDLNFDCLSAIANGLFIITEKGITDSLQQDKLCMNDKKYLVRGTARFPDCFAIRRARISINLGFPKLFDGISIHISGNKGWEQFSLEQLNKLVVNFGAQLLTCMPKPYTCPTNIIPFHCRNNKDMYRVSTIVLYTIDSDGLVKYDLEHLKTFHISWFIEAVQKYKIE